MLPLDHFESADAAADIHAGALGLVAVGDLEARGLEREFARRDGELNEAPHLLDFFFLDVERRIEVLHLARDAAIEAGGVEGGNRRDPVLALLDGFPDRFRADSNRSQHSDSSNYNSA